MEGRLFQYIVANSNKVYKARKKYTKEGKKGDIKRNGDGNNKDNSNAIVGRTRKIHVT